MSNPTHSDTPNADRWTVSYADFMTLLFALFVVLLASSRHDKRDIQKVSSAVRDGFQQLGAFPTESVENTIPAAPVSVPKISQSSGVNIVQLQNDLLGAMGHEIQRKEIVLRMTPEGFVISLHELGFFKSGEADMLPGAAEKIQRTGTILMKYGLDMRIEGHTDNLPIHTAAFKSNWDLSTARASSVAMMLISNAHFDPRKMSIAGYGEYHPTTTNDTPQGRQSNRRVDIVIISSPYAAP